jgi:D-alanyl-D-alanine carboxypeptidase (penicillin-binding protein 5/6)
MLLRSCVVFLSIISILSGNVCDAAKKRKTAERPDKVNNISTPKQAVLLDFDTEEELFTNNGDERCVPSSMTKIMTAYLVFEALTDGRLRLEDELPVSEFAKSKEGSRSFFESGTLAKVEDLIRSVVVHSGNDACTVLAEKLYGDEDSFATAMNEKAAEFGLKNTHFTNSTGLPDDDHYSCARDLALIAKRIINDFPQYYHYFSEKTFTVNGITQQNRNTLLRNSLNVDGLKTGKTDAGGYGIVVSAKKNGKRLIAVVNGCKSSKIRAIEANKLLAMGFTEFAQMKIANKEKPVGVAAVSFGKRDRINLYINEDLVVSVPKKYKDSVVVDINVKEPVDAPVGVGAKLGTLRYKYGSYVSNEYNLYAREPVAELNIFIKFIMKIKNMLFENNTAKNKPEKKIDKPGIGIAGDNPSR